MHRHGDELLQELVSQRGVGCLLLTSVTALIPRFGVFKPESVDGANALGLRLPANLK